MCTLQLNNNGTKVFIVKRDGILIVLDLETFEGEKHVITTDNIGIRSILVIK